MATELQINAVVDAVVKSFNGDPAKFEAFLKRASLETEYRELESKLRQAQATEDAQNAAFRSAYQELVDALDAKQSEIDALA